MEEGEESVFATWESELQKEFLNWSVENVRFPFLLPVSQCMTLHSEAQGSLAFLSLGKIQFLCKK